MKTAPTAEAIEEILMLSPKYTMLVNGKRVMTVDGALKIMATFSREELGDLVHSLCERKIAYAREIKSRFATIYDYANQAWIVGGVYVSCGHPESMNCNCFGRIHAGESPAANAEIH